MERSIIKTEPQKNDTAEKVTHKEVTSQSIWLVSLLAYISPQFHHASFYSECWLQVSLVYSAAVFCGEIV